MTDAREVGWVIETGRTTYWDGRQAGRNAHFTGDPDEAMRFARFEDAERARCWLLEEQSAMLRSSEHVWLAKVQP